VGVGGGDVVPDGAGVAQVLRVVDDHLVVRVAELDQDLLVVGPARQRVLVLLHRLLGLALGEELVAGADQRLGVLAEDPDEVDRERDGHQDAEDGDDADEEALVDAFSHRSPTGYD
jgi:hypothetical protein